MMNANKLAWAIAAAVIVFCPAARAQQSTTPAETPPPLITGVAVNAAQKAPNAVSIPTTEENPGVLSNGYEIKESFEFGGRITSYTGSTGTWDSYVNLGSGPRLLEYSLNMHNVAHNGFLFDDLTFNSFGYGGDPNDVSRLYLQKGNIYTLYASFRRDVNIFDYNLLANPLNPPTSNPNVPILNSPHEFLLTRRMTDTTLNLFPVAKIRVRMG